MIEGRAHTAVCVPDCDAAVAWYHDVLGLEVLSPSYVMAGDALRADMGELIIDPTMKAAIVGFGTDGDRVLEVIEYPNASPGAARVDAALTDHGPTHVALVCTDIVATRAELERRGVEFLVQGIADVARLRTTWSPTVGRDLHPDREVASRAPVLRPIARGEGDTVARIDVPDGPGGDAAMVWSLRPEMAGMVERMITTAYSRSILDPTEREAARMRIAESTRARRARRSARPRSRTPVSPPTCTRT